MTGLQVRRAAAEAIGTFFLVFIGTGAIMVDATTGGAVGAVGVSLAFGLAIAGMIYAVGHLSGAHINPAVTIAFWSIGRFPARAVPLYLIAQCAGAIAASAVLRAVLGPVASLGATAPSVSAPAAFAVEALLSFALMFVIVAVATDPRAATGFAGLAIGFTVTFDALMGGPLTGASMNPARSLGPALVGGAWSDHWLYWLGPIVGMMAAARTYELLRPAELPTATRAGDSLGARGPLDPPAG